MIIGYAVRPHGTLDGTWDVPKCTEGGNEVASWKVFAIVGSNNSRPSRATLSPTGTRPEKKKQQMNTMEASMEQFQCSKFVQLPTPGEDRQGANKGNP